MNKGRLRISEPSAHLHLIPLATYTSLHASVISKVTNAALGLISTNDPLSNEKTYPLDTSGLFAELKQIPESWKFSLSSK